MKINKCHWNLQRAAPEVEKAEVFQPLALAPLNN